MGLALLAGTSIVGIVLRHRGKTNGPHLPSWMISAVLFLAMVPFLVAYFARKSVDVASTIGSFVLPLIGVAAVALAVTMLLTAVTRKI